jgi:hypothetical protein
MLSHPLEIKAGDVLIFAEENRFLVVRNGFFWSALNMNTMDMSVSVATVAALHKHIELYCGDLIEHIPAKRVHFTIDKPHLVD